jgi:hypothetical protein
LRAYDAIDEKLFALTQSPTSLQIVDVAAALNETAAVSSVPLSGNVPVSPQAMVWDRFTGMLYVVDQIRVHQDQLRLRLLTLSPDTGATSLLWQTAPTRYPPETVYLSVSAQEEIVLALVGVLGQQTEMLIMNTSGYALLSDDVQGELIAPAFATPAGINLAFGQRPQGPQTSLRAELRSRSKFHRGTCGAKYLLENADSLPPSSGALRGDCRQSW